MKLFLKKGLDLIINICNPAYFPMNPQVLGISIIERGILTIRPADNTVF